jgi:putative membrane protein
MVTRGLGAKPLAELNWPEEKHRGLPMPLLIGVILVAYGCARVLEVTPNPIPRMAIVALDVLSAMAFALVHGARQYRLRGILVFALLCVVVGNLIENLGVITGFPFGRYYFLDLMGPKLFHIPVLLGLAYIGMAYVSWVLGCLIVGGHSNSARGFVVPLVASLIMVAWDLAQDPVWSTVLHGWVWLDGGPWFGVPISNYFGWYATVCLICFLFAFYLRSNRVIVRPQNPAWNRSAIVFYACCAAGNVLQIARHLDPAIVQDPAGQAWSVADITLASALVSIFAMGAFAALAWVRLAKQEKLTTG